MLISAATYQSRSLELFHTPLLDRRDHAAAASLLLLFYCRSELQIGDVSSVRQLWFKASSLAAGL